MTSLVETTQSLNLDEYLGKLRLQAIRSGPSTPPIPPADTRSKLMPLALLPASYRKLQVVEPLMYDICREAAAYFSTLNTFNSESLKGLKLPIHNEIAQKDSDFNPYIVNSAAEVTHVLIRFFLRSIEMLLGTIDASMSEWRFQIVPRPRKLERDIQSLDPIVLCRTDAFGYRNSAKLVVVSLAPWEFTRRDFAEFTSKQRFDDYPNDPDEDDEDEASEWTNADRLRAYLYDVCLNFDCPHFVVTSHPYWSFGFFSKYYTTAFLAPPIIFDHQPTSIVEILMYWAHVAFGRPNTIPTPDVFNETNLRPELLHNERLLQAKRFLSEGVLAMGPGLINEDAVPAKRKRCAPKNNDSMTSVKRPRVIEYARMIRRRGPPRLFKRLEKLAVDTARAKSATLLGIDPSAKNETSCGVSTAPSCPDPLPEKLIPRRKNAAIDRWRELVATIEEHGEVPQDDKTKKGSWVDVPVMDPVTGELTGDLQRIDDHSCSSCGPKSETLSECSLTEEERARWAPPADEERSGLVPIYQWFDWKD